MSITNNGYRWIATPAPLAGRYDDISFISPDVGWAVNGNGQILKTEDGGCSWKQQARFPNVYFRCISMANERSGWAGCTTPEKQLFHTTDGGENWELVTNLPEHYGNQNNADAPSAVCGLWTLNKDCTFASGTNYPERPARFLKTVDGGKTWYARDMEDVATILVDIYFQDKQIGWVVGGRTTTPNPRRSDVVPTVLKTTDGGITWEDVLKDKQGQELNLPLGEWGWKIQFLKNDPSFGVVACENFQAGAILITEDGGKSWRRQEILNTDKEMINANLEGIGFLDRNTGWVGGWGDKLAHSGRTSGTTDRGKTWIDLTHSWPPPVSGQGYPCPPRKTRGQYINRFRFIGNIAYASGNTVYKYTNQEIFKPTETEAASARFLTSTDDILCTDLAEIPITVPGGVKLLSVVLYDRFAGKVRTLLEESDPALGQRTLTWDLRDDAGEKLPPSQFMVRVTCDDASESRLIFQDRTWDTPATYAGTPHLLRED